MEGFIARANIDHYRHLLKTECDEVKRQVILRLIAEEETKLAQEMAAAGNKTLQARTLPCRAAAENEGFAASRPDRIVDGSIK
ncbi:MAG: hypothetical protein WCF20_12100 [Methylovirgula sp.]